jgi:hypothetical protein
MNKIAMLFAVVASALISFGQLAAQENAPGVVCNVKVLSDKVKDVSNLDAWQKSCIKDSMSEREKALAIWESVLTYQHQDNPPLEFIQRENDVTDPLKIANVYGYSLCSVASTELVGLARYCGLKARGWTINCHCVPEVWWNDSWHMLDASLINYFPKPDGEIASIAEIEAAVAAFFKDHPDLKGDDKKLRAYNWENNRKGWLRGPELLAKCPFYTENGMWSDRTHGWYSTMQEYDGSHLFQSDQGYALGYSVNIQLRQGEVLTRNWFNKGLHINSEDKAGQAPGSMELKDKVLAKRFTSKYGDIAPGRVGNGTLVYQPPLASLKTSAYAFDNLAVEDDRLRVADASKPGVLIIRMPCSYVYLSGEATFDAAAGAGSSVTLKLSDNNGLDWRELSTYTQFGVKTQDYKKYVFRRYDYLLKFEFKGAGSGLNSLSISHDIQHSQRPLPALDKGENTITFSAGPQEGTITVNPSTSPGNKGLQLVVDDFHPTVDKSGTTFTVATPGAMTRLRLFGLRAGADVGADVSFDDGKTFKSVSAANKTVHREYTELTDTPAGAKSAKVRFGSMPSNFGIYADYKMPNAGFTPIKITYVWTENGVEKTDVHVASKENETYKITCGEEPMMKTIILQRADTK